MSRIDPQAWATFQRAVGVRASRPSVEGSKVRSAASQLMRSADEEEEGAEVEGVAGAGSADPASPGDATTDGEAEGSPSTPPEEAN